MTDRTTDKKDCANVCGECGDTMVLKEDIEFGQCQECCAWKYRENSK